MSELSRTMDHLRDKHGDTWEVWYVPQATGKPVIRWYARKWGETDIYEADSVKSLERTLRG